MSEAAQSKPTTPAERFYAGLKQVMSVSKKEILRREAEYREQRRAKRKQHGGAASS
jgi:hypothetical protein